MRGKRCAMLLLLSAALLCALPARAEDPSPPKDAPLKPADTMLVIDASKSMWTKMGGLSKNANLRIKLGEIIGTYDDKLRFGLATFGDRQYSNCADTRTVAKLGELRKATQRKLLDGVKPKGQAPIAAALSQAANDMPPGGRLDIVLIADGGDTCDADVCAMATGLKAKSPGLRIQVLGFDAKAETEAKPLACIASATGGQFVTATNAAGLKKGLTAVFDAAATPLPTPAPAPVAEATPTPPPAAAPPTPGADAPAQAGAAPEAAKPASEAPAPAPPTTAASEPQAPATPPQQDTATNGQTTSPPQAPAMTTGQDTKADAQAPPPQPDATPTQPASVTSAPGETAVSKAAPAEQSPPPQQSSEAPGTPPPQDAPGKMAAIPKPPEPKTSEPKTSEPKTSEPKTSEPALPVPVTFKALATETGPKLETGITWRVFANGDGPESAHKLLSTHREATPTAALLPGQYLVNAAYGLSNLTKKIKVESGRSIVETFILNTGGLKLAAELSDGEKLAEGSVRFDILSDEEDQLGNRRTILGNAKPGLVIRLNAGAYHIVSQYGDANATERADLTVEPGKITEATVKHAAATVTFKLVQGLGGEALADTQWNVLTPTGDVVKKNAGALPSHILAAGSYAVVATHSGLTYTRKFSVEPGASKQVEVVVEDGPTSPEALKAILEPAVPPPGAGTFAGGDADAPDGGAALGFAPEPSGPLINPGVLFRPPVRP